MSVTILEQNVTVIVQEIVNQAIALNEEPQLDIIENNNTVQIQNDSAVLVVNQISNVVEISYPGIAGKGVPTGGNTGQVLAKKSNADYDTQWVNQSGGGGSGNSYFPSGW